MKIKVITNQEIKSIGVVEAGIFDGYGEKEACAEIRDLVIDARLHELEYIGKSLLGKIPPQVRLKMELLRAKKSAPKGDSK